MKTLLSLTIVCLVLSSCSLNRIKAGTSRSGSSMDALRDNEAISISAISEEQIKIKVITKSGKSCMGEFDYIESGKSYFGITAAKNIYHGNFSSKSKECIEALGQKSNKSIELQHIRFGGILGSSMMSTEGVVVCDDKEGMCLGKNTFKIVRE